MNENWTIEHQLDHLPDKWSLEDSKDQTVSYDTHAGLPGNHESGNYAWNKTILYYFCKSMDFRVFFWFWVGIMFILIKRGTRVLVTLRSKHRTQCGVKWICEWLLT